MTDVIGRVTEGVRPIVVSFASGFTLALAGIQAYVLVWTIPHSPPWPAQRGARSTHASPFFQKLFACFRALCLRAGRWTPAHPTSRRLQSCSEITPARRRNLCYPRTRWAEMRSGHFSTCQARRMGCHPSAGQEDCGLKLVSKSRGH